MSAPNAGPVTEPVSEPARPLPVLLVRPDGNEADAAALARAGVPTLVDPYLTVTPVDDPRPATELLERLVAVRPDESGWLVLTSPRTVAAWAALVGPAALRDGLLQARAAGLRIAAVGPASAATLPAGVTADLVGGSTSRRLAEQLVRTGSGTAFVPGSVIARPDLPQTLTAAGWRVGTLAVYDTVPVTQRPASADLVEQSQVAGVVLRSPSARRALAVHASVPPQLLLLAVGASTAAACREQPGHVVEVLGTGAAQVARGVLSALAVGPLGSAADGRHPTGAQPDGVLPAGAQPAGTVATATGSQAHR